MSDDLTCNFIGNTTYIFLLENTSSEEQLTLLKNMILEQSLFQSLFCKVFLCQIWKHFLLNCIVNHQKDYSNSNED